MANNQDLILAADSGGLSGFGNLTRNEMKGWWGKWKWLVQTLIWLAIINGMLFMVLMAAPKIEAAREKQEVTAEEAAAASAALAQTGLMVYFIFSGFASTGVVILAQDAIIQERQTGTAAWILSKPVSRVSYLLSKYAATALGVLVCMVLIQGAAAYFIYQAGTGIALSAAGFLKGLGCVYLVLLFYLGLTFMLGALFKARGPVIGLPLLLIFGNQLSNLIPLLGKILPWNLVMDLGPDQPALAVQFAQGGPIPSASPLIGTAVLGFAFILVAIWRLSREEF